MSNTTSLVKILDIRKQEKNDALLEKKMATDHFEKVANELYLNLKTREQAEDTLDNYVQSEIIKKIREQTLYIDALNNKISFLQEKVQIARNEMEQKQVIVTEKHVEVKKIEKMIEKRELEKIEEEKRLEMNLMDEISIRQFTRAK